MKIIEKYGWLGIGTLLAIICISLFVGIFNNSDIKDKLPTVHDQHAGNNDSVLDLTKKPILTVTSSKILLNQEFDILNYITATDYQGNDIKSLVNVYGNVDSTKKGVYDIVCTVSYNNLTTRKEATFLVD